MINIKYCKRCKEAFDIATNFDLCPRCRMNLPQINNKGGLKNMEQKQRTLKEEAQQVKAPTKSRNISELSQVSTSLIVEEETFTNNEGKEVNIKIVKVGTDKYRVPQSVLNSLNVILEENPMLKTFKVKKTGEGMETRYTIIPLS